MHHHTTSVAGTGITFVQVSLCPQHHTTQVLPSLPTPSHPSFHKTKMVVVNGASPTAPPMAECGNTGCTSPAELQCGYCIDMYFCSKDACFDALHREPDRAVHRKSVSAYGTTSMCALHRGQELRLICEDPARRNTWDTPQPTSRSTWSVCAEPSAHMRQI